MEDALTQKLIKKHWWCFFFFVLLLGHDGKLLTPMCLCHQAVQFGTGQRAVMLCGREGNHRPGVALAMRHRLPWFIHPLAQRLWEGDEHPTYAPEWHVLIWRLDVAWLYLPQQMEV